MRPFDGGNTVSEAVQGPDRAAACYLACCGLTVCRRKSARQPHFDEPVGRCPCADNAAAQLQRFLATVTEAVYQAKGATLLYVPTDDLSDMESCLKDKDLIQRLEATVIYWTRQIKEVMMLQVTGTLP